MKKMLIIILMLFFVTRCGKNPHLDLTVFVDSIGIDYNKETKEYTLYYHIATSDTLLTTELGANSVDNKYSIASIKSNDLYDAIKVLTENSVRNVLLTHVQSVIFTEDFISKENLDYFDSIIKTYNNISPNFYIFVTDSKLDNVYSIKNPDNISSFFSIITSNNYITTYNLTYYTEFVQAWYEETLLLKLIKISSTDKIWKDEKDKLTTLYISGELYIRNDGTYVKIDNDDYKALELLNHEYISTIIFEGIHFSLHEFAFKIIEKDNKFIFTLYGKIFSTNVNSNNSVEIVNLFKRNVNKELEKLVDLSKEKNIDIFDFEDKIYRKYNKKGQFDLQNVQVEYKSFFKLMN